MKHKQRGSSEPHFVDPDFIEALDENESGGASRRQVERKTRQFCRQVQQALNAALAAGTEDLFVEEVAPAPDCGRLLVYVQVPPDLPVAEAMSVLGRDTPRLRAEVAAAITRKRAPELCFAPVSLEGGGDE